MTLPLVLALHIHDVSSAVVLLVGLLALALAVVGFRSYRRSGNPSLGFVIAAFFVLAAKGLFGAWAIQTRAIGHEHLEMTLAVADLLVVSLLAAPLLRRARGRAGASG